MDYSHIANYCAIAVLVAWVIGPVVRRLVHSALFKTGAYIEGKASVVCSKCHITTHKFQYMPEGGARCSKCSNWE